MCGIIGFSGHFDQAALEEGLKTIAHRGPDDSGVFIDQQAAIGLGHARLAILDPSPAGHQPMTARGASVSIIFNGEIYNFHSLRAELTQNGYEFGSDSDTEVLLKLYLEHGEAMLPKLNGIFAFAIWDAREQSLFIARDALGVKPVYYSATANGFAFASEIKGLLHLLTEPGGIDLNALHLYLTFLWSPGSATLMRNVKKLEPGQAMIVRDGQIARLWTWYRLPMFRGAKPDLREAEAVAGLEERLRAAVHSQMIADVPLGAFLSGGLDSSAVVAFARENDPHIHCFTIDVAGGNERGTTEDLPYARRVAAHLGVRLDIVTIDAHRMADDLERMIYHLDEPLADPAALNVLYISRLAREQGIKVLLSGAGGDDLFTGYRRHLAIAHDHVWDWLPRPMRAGLASMAGRVDKQHPWSRRVAKLLDGVELDPDERLARYFAWSNPQLLLGLFTDGVRARLARSNPEKSLAEFIAPLDGSCSRIERALALEQRHFLGDHNLIYTDKMAMAAGVEVRVPFLDGELVEFAARIPSSLKLRGRHGKWVLKQAMERHLPHDVIYRPKTGFGAPVRRWMKHELRKLTAELLSEDSLRRRNLFAPNPVRRLIEDNDQGRVDASYTLFSMLCVEIWCRLFIDGNRRDFESLNSSWASAE